MTFKPITYETYGKTETWGVDYENNLVLTPGGNVLPVSGLIEWLRHINRTNELYSERLQRVRLLAGPELRALIEKDWDHHCRSEAARLRSQDTDKENIDA